MIPGFPKGKVVVESEPVTYTHTHTHAHAHSQTLTLSHLFRLSMMHSTHSCMLFSDTRTHIHTHSLTSTTPLILHHKGQPGMSTELQVTARVICVPPNPLLFQSRVHYLEISNTVKAGTLPHHKHISHPPFIRNIIPFLTPHSKLILSNLFS